MAISLGGITLNNTIIWENEFDNPSIAMSEVRTIGGRKLVQQAPVQGGRIIDLVSQRIGNQVIGYFTRDEVESIKAFEEAGTSIVFIYESITLNVLVRSGGVSVRPTVARPNQGSDDWYTGTITLVEVGG